VERTFVDFWVGAFVLAGIAALLVLALKVGNATTFNLAETYTLAAEFDNIGGLKTRAPVKSSGVVVGRVADIQFDTERFVARVTFTIDKRYQFPKDTFANILTSGLLGEQYVGLSAGGDSEMLKEGDTITQTQSAVVLEELISRFLFEKAAEGAPKK
jgi:phospholipid/cholesterol/gamma-HCH transport system substrate-binding protein